MPEEIPLYSAMGAGGVAPHTFDQNSKDGGDRVLAVSPTRQAPAPALPGPRRTIRCGASSCAG
jgi:hypothetical protein